MSEVPLYWLQQVELHAQAGHHLQSGICSQTPHSLLAPRLSRLGARERESEDPYLKQPGHHLPCGRPY